VATLKQLETALVNADKAGDMDAARRLAVIVKAERERLGDTLKIPGTDEFGDVPGTVSDPKSKPTSLGDKVLGAGESILSTGSSIVAPVIGAGAGMIKGIKDAVTGQPQYVDGKDQAAETADKVTNALSYAPRTESGQRIMQKVGEVAEPLSQLDPMIMPQQLGAVGEMASAARPVARVAAAEAAAPIKQAIATKVIDPVKQAAGALADKVTEAIAPGSTATRTAGTGVDAGAAATDLATMRRKNAEELGFTGDKALTEGQATRDFQQQRFERETAKQGDIGEPIRQRMQNQNLHLQQKMDEFIDSTGAELSDSRGVGEITDKALRSRAARDKTKIRALYKEADKAGEMSQKVDLSPVMQVLKDSESAKSTAPVLGATEAELNRLSSLNYSGRGEYNALTLGHAEQLRKFINKVAGNDPTNIKFASELKSAIDTATEGKGGDLYKQARAARAQYGADYERFGLAKQILNTKRGSHDRAIALEDVLRKSVLEPSASVDSVSKLKTLLQTEGETGQQAWKELQGGMLRHIKDEALKGVSRDTAGNQIVSASALDKAVTALDKTGKLDAVLGKKQAEKVRLINDVAKDVFTSPPGAVNTSNTATVLAGLLDVAISGTTGVPAPVATIFNQVTSRIKDAKLRARVKTSLGE
jgi:hypothetical protein